MKYFIIGLMTLTLGFTTSAEAVNRCKTKSCEKRVLAKKLKKEMQYYKKHQMPWCTWGPESGRHLPPFHPARYVAKNPNSTASGKFQFLDSTWRAIGGGRYAYSARYAKPVYQERMARRLLRIQGLGAWVNC